MTTNGHHRRCSRNTTETTDELKRVLRLCLRCIITWEEDEENRKTQTYVVMFGRVRRREKGFSFEEEWEKNKKL